MALAQSKVYTVLYTLKDSEGEIVDEATRENPFLFMSNADQVLPLFEKEVSGMLIGGKKNFTIDAKEGYGEYKEEAIQVVSRNEFPQDVELEEGMQMVANTPDGHQLPFVITDLNDDEVTIDFNHPLAGETLNFEVELIDVRDATQEEIAHGHAHGGDGHHH